MWNIYVCRWSECKESLSRCMAVFSKMALVERMWKYPFHISFTSLLKMLIITQFYLADHQIDRSETEYQLKHTDECKVLTRHFCSTCIATSVLLNEHTTYYLNGGMSFKGQN